MFRNIYDHACCLEEKVKLTQVKRIKNEHINKDITYKKVNDINY